MATSPKTYKETICPDCGKVEVVRTDSKRVRCRPCAMKIRFNGSKHKLSPRSFTGTLTEYKTLHMRVRRKRGPASECVFGCKSSRYHWANISGRYDDVYDYVELCPTCHDAYDRRKLELP